MLDSEGSPGNESTDTPPELDSRLGDALQQVNRILVGKPRQVELAFTCLLAGGHLLIEDLPGVGKTTLAHALARTLGADYQRIQFTSDLLPADIIGVSVYRRDTESFDFHPGPIFTQIVLADEINRATPKTQSALLEAMAEHQVTVDGHARSLPQPFFVLATQNPQDLVGTFPLPESQLDRFLFCLTLGYPDAEAERQLLTQRSREYMLQEITPVLNAADLAALQARVGRIRASEPLIDYVQQLVGQTREHPRLSMGLSPRAALALLRAGRALALIRERDFCIPEDIQAVFPSLARHRLVVTSGTARTALVIAQDLLAEVEIP